MSAFEEVIARKVRDQGVYLPAGVLKAILKTSEIGELRKRAADAHHPLPPHVGRWVMEGETAVTSWSQPSFDDVMGAA